MKKSVLFLMVALMAVTTYAGTFSFSGGTMYFDKSQTQEWNEAKIMLIIGHDSYGAVYEMTESDEANLWKCDLPASWEGATYMAVINHSGWDSGNFGYSTVEQNASHYSAPYTDGLISESGKSYLFTPQSSENGCVLVLTERSSETVDPEPEIDPALLVNWFVPGNFIDNDWRNPKQMYRKEDGAENIVYTTWNLAAGKEYVFKIRQGVDPGTWFGNKGMMTQANHTNWTFDTDDNCALITTIGGGYEFAFDTIQHILTVEYPFNPKQATLYATPVKDNNTDILLQAFYWAHEENTDVEYTAFGDVKWAALNNEADEIAANFDLVWLAPSQETADYTGYLPINLSKQGQVSEGTQGHTPWGSAQDLRELIDNLHKGGAKVVADIVLNHSSASHPDEYSGPNSNWFHWGTFDFGQYGQFNPDYTWITQGDEVFWDKRCWAGNELCLVENMEEMVKDNQLDEWEVDDNKGGTYIWQPSESNCLYSRDWAHKKKEVREMSRAFLTWMRDSIGYDGFRYDFMKGFHGSHLYDYNCASAPCFSVAELFDGRIDLQIGYLRDANFSTYVFDFPGKFSIYNDAIRSYKLENLKGNGNTLIYGDFKKYAVTFCDNHDSFKEEDKSLNYHPNTLEDRQAHQALAYLLSMPGVPCVFYPYWNNYKAECKAFIKARRAAGVHSQSYVVEDWAACENYDDRNNNTYYNALIKGEKGYIFLKLGKKSAPTTSPGKDPDGNEYQLAWGDDEAAVWYSVDNGVSTGVENTQTDTHVTKFFRDGVLYIQRGEHIYTAEGLLIQ